MKAVWSFWSKPYLSGRKACWASETHHWLYLQNLDLSGFKNLTGLAMIACNLCSF